MFTPWNELSRKEQLAATHYDFYKDVHGIRPRWMNYDAMTEQELEVELDNLSKEAEVVAAREAAEQAVAIERFEARVTDIISSGAQNRETAIRWIMDAEDADGDDEFLCYLLGLPYGYFRKVA